MKSRIKITMVGGKNVGKTCFLHGMYYVMRRGVNNFFLHTDTDADTRLMRGWAAMNKRGKERRWPVPTSDDITHYNFSFKRGLNNTLMEFEWVDYRGGALMEGAKTSEELINHLNNSDCLFFCLDGSELETPVAGERLYDVDNRMCISRAKVLLDRLPRRVPIAVLITKHDLCRHRLKDDLMADIRLLFDAWLVPGEGWDVLFCPVTLGRQLADDIAGGQLNPKNMHVPLVYAIFSIVLEDMVEKESKVRTAFEGQQAADRSASELGGRFLGGMLKKNEIQKAKRESENFQRIRAAEERAAERVREDVVALGRELTNAVMYCNGKRVGVPETAGVVPTNRETE